jgi:serine/threonine protein kinase
MHYPLSARAALVALLLACASTSGENDNPQPALLLPTPPSPLLAGALVASPQGFSYRLVERVRRLGRPTTSAGLPASPSSSSSSSSSLSPLPRRTLDGALPSTATVGQDGPEGAGTSSVYALEDLAGRGHQGEVWRAVRVSAGGCEGTDEASCPSESPFVLKRIFGGSSAALLSGYREVHFGLHPRLRGSPFLSRFVEHFLRAPDPTAAASSSSSSSSSSPQEPELWLVFHDEGVSLQRLLFLPLPASTQLAPSPFWVRLRTAAAGDAVFRTLAAHLLAGLAAVHAADGDGRGSLHRDIKPGNVLVGVTSTSSSSSSSSSPTVRLRVADFGSGVDEHARAHLYPSDGPSTAEETAGYTPPEVILTGLPYAPSRPESYDLFSAGVTLLELLLGLPASSALAPPPRLEALVLQRFGMGREQQQKQKDDINREEGGGVGSESDNDDNGDDEADQVARSGHEDIATALRIAGLVSLGLCPEDGDAANPGSLVSRLLALSVRAERRSAHHADAAAPCGLEAFRLRLRALDADARERAEALFATGSAPGAAAAEEGDKGGVSRPSSSAYAVWAEGPRQSAPRAGPLVVLRAQEASVAAFGEAHALAPLGAALPTLASAALPAPPSALSDPTALWPAVTGVRAAAVVAAGTPGTEMIVAADGGVEGVVAVDEGVDGDRRDGAARDEEGSAPLPGPVPLLGEEGEELLYRLLLWAPEQRISAEEALAHPFLGAAGAAAAAEEGRRAHGGEDEEDARGAG